MQKTARKIVFRHAPTLTTIRMVEKVLKESDESAIKIAELKRRLPRQVNHNTLMEVLGYLEESNKIVFGSKGITWLTEPNLRMMKAISEGTEV